MSSYCFSATVDTVRLSNSNEKVRVVFDLSANAAHSLFSLESPDRIVIDIKDSKLVASTNTLNLTGTGIKAVRTGVWQKKDVRFVFELANQTSPTSFLLQPKDKLGYRLVVDFPKSGISGVVETAPVVVNKTVENISDKKRDLIIAIDAGHGGRDPGSIGKAKTQEKDITLAIAKDLQALFNKEPGYQAFLTRSKDVYVGLKQRRDLAREKKADLFISIHADAFKNRGVSGASVYALSTRGATSTLAAFLAANSNASDDIGGVNLDDKGDDLKEVLLDLHMDASINASMSVGQSVINSLKSEFKMHGDKMNSAAFMVLKSPDVPSILVETGFISNVKEEKNLGSSAYRKKLAKYIKGGVENYFNANPIPGTYVAYKLQSKKKLITYTVKNGDTLSHIAVRNRVSMAQIKQINNLKSNSLKIGQKLKIPGV